MEPRLQENLSKTADGSKEAISLRCCCGSLLARVVAEGVELKCRRCKRQVVVPLESKAGARNNM